MSKGSKSVKAFELKGVSLSPLNPCRAIVKNQPSRRAFYAEALIQGGQFKSCWKRAAIAWGKQMGLDKEASVEKYHELMPSTPYGARYVLNVIREANAKRGVKVKTIFDKEGIVTVSKV